MTLAAGCRMRSGLRRLMEDLYCETAGGLEVWYTAPEGLLYEGY